MATKKTRPGPQTKSKTRTKKLALALPAAKAKVAETAAVETAQAQPTMAANKAGNPVDKKPAPKMNSKPVPSSAPMRFETYSLSADFGVPGREVLEACMTCGTIAAKGVESLSKEVVDFTRASAEAQFALTKALLDAKTMEDAFEAQSVFTRESFDSMATEWAKLTDMTVELSQKLMEPIQAQAKMAPWTAWEPIAA